MVDAKIRDKGKCPRCQGRGTESRPEDERYGGGGFGFNVGNRMVRVTCTLCGGSGKAKGLS